MSSGAEATEPVALAPAAPADVSSKGGRQRRQAVIFIPGMGDTWVNQTVATIGGKFASALDHEAATRSAKFKVEIWEENYGPNSSLTAAGCTITRDGNSGAPPIDIYRLDSIRDLRAGWEKHSLLFKALLPLYLLISYSGKALKRNRENGKTFRERFQFFYAIAVAVTLSVYVGLVIYSIVALVVPAKALNGLNAQIPQGITLVMTLLGLKKATFVTQATAAATGYLSVMSYFRYGANRENLVGNLARLIQHLNELEKFEYDRIDVVAYSFGSIVALDAFFPALNRNVSTFNQVGQLIMVGCPFDFVRTYWPDYFRSRQRPMDYGRSAPLKWLNVYLPIDILSSNFRNDADAAEPTVGIPTAAKDAEQPENLIYIDPSTPTKLGLVDFVFLMGLQSHSFYWGSAESSDLGVFPRIVERLYTGEPILS